MWWLSAAGAALKAVAAFFGWVSKEQDIQSGVDKQKAADQASTIATLDRENRATAKTEDTDAKLRDGTF